MKKTLSIVIVSTMVFWGFQNVTSSATSKEEGGVCIIDSGDSGEEFLHPGKEPGVYYEETTTSDNEE